MGFVCHSLEVEAAALTLGPVMSDSDVLLLSFALCPPSPISTATGLKEEVRWLSRGPLLCLSHEEAL